MIDCTGTGKSLCNEFDIRGYPTLKFSLDGEVQDYPSGRNEHDIVAFADRMKQEPVTVVYSIDEMQRYLKESTDGIAFVAFHPAVSALPPPEEGEERTLFDKVQSSAMTQLFSQAARKEQAYSHLLLLDVNPETNPATALGLDSEVPFVCRVEVDVPPRCYNKGRAEDISLTELLNFVRSENTPTINIWRPRVLEKSSDKGKPLVVTVIEDNDTEQRTEAQKVLSSFVNSGPKHLREQFLYGWIHVKQYAKYLEQFSVVSAPQVFLLNLQNKTFWQDESYGMDVDKFLRDVESGKIAPRKARRRGVEGLFDLAANFAEDNLKLVSVIVIIFFYIIFSYVALWAASEDGDEEYTPLVTSDVKKNQ